MVKVSLIPLLAATKANAMPNIAASGLDQLLAGTQQTVALGCRHHRRTNPALHRIGRVAPFDLGQHPRTAALGDAVEQDSGVRPIVRLLSLVAAMGLWAAHIYCRT